MKKFLYGFAALLITGTIALAAGTALQNGSGINGHFLTLGKKPTIDAGGTLTAGSGDFAGQVSMASGNSTFVLTFATAFAVLPWCVVTTVATADALRATSTTTTLTVSGANSADKVNYICIGTPAN